MTQLSILYVAYPLLSISPESAGGAEQALLTVEREMAKAGHRTTVAASTGSQVAGRLLSTGPPVAALDDYERRERQHHGRILEYLRQHPTEFDLIHDHSGSFFRHAADSPVPVLATLHLPRSFYPQDVFQDPAPNLFFNFVSHSQAQLFADCPNVLGVVRNGIATERYPLVHHKNAYLLWLGRICEEKAPHLAIAAAEQANLPLILAGQVYPFRYHQAYFEREVRPRMGSARMRFVSSPGFAHKVKLLQYARALLVTSTVAETSSLAAMEAGACGTPVIAFRHGALPEIVADGETGFLVDTVEEMSAWLSDVRRVLPETCRAHVLRHFRATRMAQEYEALYRQVLAEGIRAAA